MKRSYITLIIYTLLLISGGIVGFVKAGSIPSLAAGCGFGAILSLLTYQVIKGKVWANYGAFFVILFLDGFFWWRYYKTEAFMPAGLMLLISSVVLFILYTDLKKQLTNVS
ncbi:MAG: TMEM14 family protein [Simkaniaceae bacterium]|nr:TMEM14 family protein [Simkaniaceae bacterium]